MTSRYLTVLVHDKGLLPVEPDFSYNFLMATSALKKKIVRSVSSKNWGINIFPSSSPGEALHVNIEKHQGKQHSTVMNRYLYILECEVVTFNVDPKYTI